MAFNAAELTKDGQLNIAGNINTRLPVITDGLVAHFPFDGRGGAFDGVGGNQTLQNVETGVNLIEAMQSDWRDPNSWSSNSGMSWDEGKQALKIDGYHNSTLKTPIIVDTTKHYQVSIEVMEEVQSSAGLYLGGLCNNASGKRVTPNYDYSYGANAQPATGVWTKYCCTRYGTGDITSNTSTTFATTVGWMGTNTGVVDKMTKYYYYGGLFNYSGGGVMYIRNLNITIIDADTSNTTITNDGIAVEEATTNLFANPSLVSSTSGWYEYDNAGKVSNLRRVQIYDSPLPNVNYAMAVDMVNGGGGGTGFYISGGSHTAGVYYTKSMWVKSSIDGVVASATYSNIEYNGSSVTLKAGIWTRISATHYNASTTQSDSLHFGFVGPAGSSFTIWGTAAQWEAKAFATSFVNGSRGSGARITAESSIINKTQGSINCQCFLQKTELWKRIISFVGGATINGETDLNFDIGPSDDLRLKVMHTQDMQARSEAGTIPSNKWITLSCSWGEYGLKIYVDGEIVGISDYVGGISAVDSVIGIGERQDGSINPLSGIISNLSFYNRQLSDNEIKQLASPTFELKPSGDLIIPSIISKPILPNDVYYFPLGSDGKDEYKVISPTTETNTVYENGAVWIGTASINLIDPSAYSLNSNNGGVYPIQNELYEGHRRVRRNPDFVTYPSTAFSCYTGTFFDAIIGKYSFSLKVRPEKDVRLKLGPSTTLCLANQWTTLTCTVDIAIAASTRGHGLTSPDPFNSNFNPWIEYKEYQIEQKAFSTPFVNGTRARGILTYTPSQLGINVNTDNWTFGLFVKAHPNLMASTGTRYNPLEIGSYYLSNETSLSYFHQSYANDFNGVVYDNLVGRTPPGRLGLNVADFNNWVFICFRMEGSILKMSAIGQYSGLKTTTTTKTWTTSIRDIVHVGCYGWESSDMYCKDFIAAKRAMTDAEINNIFKDNMQGLNNGTLQIKDSIRTGQVIL